MVTLGVTATGEWTPIVVTQSKQLTNLQSSDQDVYTSGVTQAVLRKVWGHKDWRINNPVITDWGGNTPGVTQTKVSTPLGTHGLGRMYLWGQTDFGVANSGVTLRGVDTPGVTRLGPRRWRVGTPELREQA